jgi:hypothetical protein
MVGIVEEAADIIRNILEASAEFPMIGTAMGGTILLWNEVARHSYG